MEFELTQERRRHDKEIRDAMHMLLRVFDIDPSDPEGAQQAAVEANKDFRFLRKARLGTANSIWQVRKLTIATAWTALVALVAKGLHGVGVHW